MKNIRDGIPVWMFWLCLFGLGLALLTGCGGSAAPEEGFLSTQPFPPTATGGVLPTPLPTLDPAQVVANALASLEQGRLLYNPPTEMKFSETERVEARISLNPEEDLTENLQGSGQPIEESIPVTNFMKVQLKGQAFEITALNSEEQVVVSPGYTQWSWDVTPQKSGDQSLVLTVSARVKIPDYPDETKDLQVVERVIQVQVSPGRAALNFIEQNLGWIAPIILSACVAAIGWAWRRRKTKINPPEDG
jgi:hypothetical protein